MSYVPDLNAYGMLSDLGNKISAGVKEYQQKQLLSALGQDLLGGDYNSAASKALAAGDMGTGLKLMELGRQRQIDAALPGLLQGPSLGGGQTQAPATQPAPQGSDLSSAPMPASTSQLPAGMRNNNPGNIKFTSNTAFPGVVGPSKNLDEGDPQAVFATPEAGMAAMYSLAKRKYDGGKTSAASLIAGNMGWTPGNMQAAANVARTMGIGVNDDLKLNDPAQAAKFMRALMLQEHGGASRLYSDDMVASAIGGGRAPSSAMAFAPSRSGYAVPSAIKDQPAQNPAEYQGGGEEDTPAPKSQMVQLAQAGGAPVIPTQRPDPFANITPAQAAALISSGHAGAKAVGEMVLKRFAEQNAAAKWSPMTDPAQRASYGIAKDDTRPFMISNTGELKPIDEPKESKDRLQKLGTDASGREIYGYMKDGKVVVPEVPGMGRLSGADGNAPLSGEEYLKTLDPQTAAAVKAIHEGRMSATGRRLQQLLTMAAQYDPSFDQQRYQERLTMQKSMSNSTLQSFGGQLKSANQAISHANEAYDLIDKLGNYTNAPGIMNRLHQGYASQFDPKYQDTLARFRTSISAVSSELGKVFTGNAPALETLRHWRESMSELDSPVAIKAGLSEAMKLLHGGVSAITDRYNQVMGTQKDASEFLTPQTRDAFDKIALGRSGATGPQPPKIGDVMKGYRFKGGDPSKQENWHKMGGG